VNEAACAVHSSTIGRHMRESACLARRAYGGGRSGPDAPAAPRFSYARESAMRGYRGRSHLASRLDVDRLRASARQLDEPPPTRAKPRDEVARPLRYLVSAPDLEPHLHVDVAVRRLSTRDQPEGQERP
jgi:hypothetical protein